MNDTKGRRTAWSGILIFLLAVAVVLYIVSAGPAYILVRDGTVTERQYEAFYWPVLKAVRMFGPVDAMGRKYRDWWSE
jgi:hypothetical protein